MWYIIFYSKPQTPATFRFHILRVFRFQIILKPSWKGDTRFRYSGYDCGETFSSGRYVTVLPILEAMREKEAEQLARDDGARVLQRAFGGLLARRKGRDVCYELMEVSGSSLGRCVLGSCCSMYSELLDDHHYSSA